jgi:hypothetical protein
MAVDLFSAILRDELEAAERRGSPNIVAIQALGFPNS